MRFLYLSSFPNSYNPHHLIQRRKSRVMSELAARGHRILAFARRPGAYALGLPGLRWRYLHLMYDEKPTSLLSKLMRTFWLRTAFGEAVLRCLVLPVAKHWRPDAVLCEGWPLAWTWLRASDCSIPVIVRVYGVNVLPDWIDTPHLPPHQALYLRRVAEVVNDRRVVLIACNRSGSRSRYLLQSLSTGADRGIDKHYLLPNDLYRCRQVPAQRERLILQVGRMTEDHYFDLGIAVAARFLRDRSDGTAWRVVFVGDGPELDRVRSRAAALLGPHVSQASFPGRVSAERLQDLYCRARLLFSFYGYNPLIEAINGGCSVVSREYGELGEILRELFGDAGFTVFSCSSASRIRISENTVPAAVDYMVAKITEQLQLPAPKERAFWRRRIDIESFARGLVSDYEEAILRVPLG